MRGRAAEQLRQHYETVLAIFDAPHTDRHLPPHRQQGKEASLQRARGVLNANIAFCTAIALLLHDEVAAINDAVRGSSGPMSSPRGGSRRPVNRDCCMLKARWAVDGAWRIRGTHYRYSEYARVEGETVPAIAPKRVSSRSSQRTGVGGSPVAVTSGGDRAPERHTEESA